MGLSMNSFSEKLTNFKIKFTKDPSPIQISNKDIRFIAYGQEYIFNSIFLNMDEGDGVVYIRLE